MASAASVPPSADRAAAAPVTPAVSRSIGSSSPISPVEQTATSPAETPSACATCSAVAWVSGKPWGPVQALAPPELRTTASTRPSASTWRLHVTGAASTRLPVKTAAAWWSGPSLTTRATSGRPLGLSPAVTPAARNPAGAVTLTAPPPTVGSPVVSGRPRARLAHWMAAPAVPLVRLSTARDGDDPPGALVERDLDLHHVAAEDVRRPRPLPLGQQAHERLVGVRLLPRGADLGRRRARGGPGGAGGEDAARHRREGGGEGDGDRAAGGEAEVLLDLGGVPVGAAHAVRRHRRP